MKQHFTIREKELHRKLLSGELLEADVKAAFELAQDTSKAEHIGLYSQFKRAFENQEEEKANTPTSNEVQLAEDMIKLFKEGNDFDTTLKQFEAIKEAYNALTKNEGADE
jgi:hypothetical protein